MTTLSELETLHKAFALVLDYEKSNLQAKTRPISWSNSKSRNSGKCGREHALLATFVPLNRNMAKYLQQVNNGSKSDYAASRGRFRYAPDALLHAIFKHFIEAPQVALSQPLRDLPLLGSMLREVPELQLSLKAEELNTLRGRSLDEVRHAFWLNRSTRQEQAAHDEARTLQEILLQVEATLSARDYALLEKVVHRSLSASQKRFLSLP
jgi:hypothetical protein